jgi:integrase
VRGPGTSTTANHGACKNSRQSYIYNNGERRQTVANSLDLWPIFGRKLVREGATAGTVQHTEMSSRTARSRLKRGRQPHWQALVRGRVHLGYQRWKGAAAGRWVLRRYIGNGKYRVEALGVADDADDANGLTVLDFEQAEAKARAMVATTNGGDDKIERITVRQAMKLYIEHKRTMGQPVSDIISRSNVHIVPVLGDSVVAELTAKRLREWHATMAAAAAQSRPKAGKAQYRDAPSTDDEVRARRASANRVLTMLKAALNHAYDERHVNNRDAWDRKLKPYKGVETARIRYLSVPEAERLLNASEPDFRPLVRAALETGCRYSELARLEVHDFNADASTVAIRKSKSGKARHVMLTAEGAEFFLEHCAGRSGGELMFQRANGSKWQPSDQGRPMNEAVRRAKIRPPISFHGLRHTWASLAVMNGVPLIVVAKNLGHRDTRMVEQHYGHLAPSYVAEAIRAGAPRFGTTTPSTVVPLPAGKKPKQTAKRMPA